MAVQGHAVLIQIDQIIRVQAVAVIDIDLVMYIFQHKHHARRRVRRGGCYCADAARAGFQLGVMLGVFQQFHAELVQPQVGNGNAAAHILKVHDLSAQALQLLAPVFQIALFLGA